MWKRISKYAEITVVVAIGFVLLHYVLDAIGISIAPIS